MLSIVEERAFRAMFVRLLRIGERNQATIKATPRNGWNSSSAKVVDNAIVGYILGRLGSVPLNSPLEPAAPH